MKIEYNIKNQGRKLKSRKKYESKNKLMVNNVSYDNNKNDDNIAEIWNVNN